jgi:hypothetical protein
MRADAEADLADAVTVAGILGGQIADVDVKLAEVRAEQAREEARARAEEASRLGDELAPQAAAALRDAVTGDGTAKALTALAARLVAAEAACGRSWDALVLPPALPGNARDPWLWGVQAVWRAAKAGDASVVQVAAGRLGGAWQDRGEAFRREIADALADFERMQQEGMARGIAMAARQAAGRQPVILADPGAVGRSYLAEMREAGLRMMAERGTPATALDHPSPVQQILPGQQ